jgi:hypothetical protein
VENPYQPPAATISEPAAIPVIPADARLFKVSGIGLATFFSNVMGGGLLMALNYRALGEADKARRALWYSVIGSIIVLAVAFMLPDRFPALLITLPQVFFITRLAEREQGRPIEQARTTAQPMRSNWLAFGIGLLVTIVQIAIGVGIYAALYFAGIVDID